MALQGFYHIISTWDSPHKAAPSMPGPALTSGWGSSAACVLSKSGICRHLVSGISFVDIGVSLQGSSASAASLGNGSPSHARPIRAPPRSHLRPARLDEERSAASAPARASPDKVAKPLLQNEDPAEVVPSQVSIQESAEAGEGGVESAGDALSSTAPEEEGAGDPAGVFVSHPSHSPPASPRGNSPYSHPETSMQMCPREGFTQKAPLSQNCCASR